MPHRTMATLLNIFAPSPAGAAKNALELFRKRMMTRKVKNSVENRQADSPLAQARFSQAYGLVATARLHSASATAVVAASYQRQPSNLTEEERA